MAQADWLLEVGVDTTKATQSLVDFKASANKLLMGLGNDVEIHLDTDKITGDAEKVVASLKKTLAAIPKVSIKFDLSGASKSVNAFARAIQNNSTTLSHFGYMLELLNGQVDATMVKMSELGPIVREAAESVRTISNYLRNASENTELASKSVQVYTRAIEQMQTAAGHTSESYNKVASAIRSSGVASEEASVKHKAQHDVIERLGSIIDNTVFKFVEYEVVMRAFNGVVHEFTSSLTEASNVQFESTLQKLYAPTVNLNGALNDSIIIAKQYGSDITDVQQAIGLWTKVTGDETTAAYLAIEAEKLRRISGIDTMEVFKDSVAVLKQMGLAAKDLPGVYDQIAEAALRIAEPLKNMGKGGIEGVKDMMDGLTRFGAVGKGIGLDTTGILALTANQIQSSAEGGKSEGSALSNMVGALDTGSKSKANFDKIIGPISGSDDYEKSLNLMKRMESEAPRLAKAMADGDIRVKPGQIETFRTLEASIKGTITLMEDLHNHSAGKLDIITDAELRTFQGRMDQLKASVQAFSLSFGKQILPGATSLAMTLSQVLLPALEHNVGAIMELGHVLASLAIAGLLSQGFTRLTGSITAYQAAAVKAAVATADEAASLKLAQIAGFDNTQQMVLMQQEMRETAATQAALRNSFIAFGEACGLAGRELSVYADEQMAVARSNGQLAAAVKITGTELGIAAAAGGRWYGALGGMAMGALRAIGPFAALSAAIWGVSTAMEGMSAAGSAEAGMEERKYENDDKGNFFQRLAPSHIFQGTQTALKRAGAFVSGNSGHENDVWNYANSISRNKTDEGKEARDLLLRMRGKDKGEAYDKDADKLTGLYTTHIQRDASTETDARIRQIEEEAKKAQGEFSRPQSSPSGDVQADSGPAKGAASPESQVMGDIQRTTKDFQARATEARDNAAAEKELAEAILERTKATGVSAKDVTAYSNALKEQAKDLNNELYLREEEAKALKKVSDNANALAKGADKKTTKGQHALNDKASAEANLNKTNGAIALLREQYRLLIAQDANLRASMALTYDIHANGLDNAADKIEQIKKNVSNQTDYAGTSSATTSGTATLQAMLKHAQAVANNPNISGDAQTLQKARKDVEDLKDAIAALGKTEEDATSKAQGFSDSLKTVRDNVYAENTADIAKALGIDTGSLDALNTSIEMFKKMAEEIKSAKDDYDKSLKTPADAANYSHILNEIRERDQLAPILAKEAKLKADIKKTEDSATYKMVDAEVKKYGDKTIDQITKPLGTGFGGSMINGALKDTWATASKSITDNMFGVDKEKEKEITLQSIYKEHVAGLQKSADEFKETVDKLLAGLSTDKVGTESSGGVSTPLSAAASAATTSSNYDNPFVRAINGTDTNHADDTLSALQDIKTNTTPASGDAAAHYADYPSVANLGGLSSGAADSADGIPVKIASIATGGSSGGGYSPLSMVIPGFSAAEGGIAKDAGLSGSANPFSQLLSGGLPAFNKSLSGGISKIMGNGGLTMGDIGLGIGVGQLSGSLFGGGSHTTNGELGGIAGSGLGALGTALGIFGPGGAIIGALAGGMLGGMFGHSDNVQAMPDKYDNNFAQETANLTGKSYTSEASGQQFMSAGVASSTGGQGQISSIEELLAKYPNPQDAPAWLQPYYAQALSTFGASSTGAGVLKFGKDIANEHIEGAAGASTADQNYQGINSLAAQIEQAQALHTNTAQAPILSINAYGTNGSYGNSIYNTPGLTSDQFNAVQGNAFQGANLNNYYGTPGVGTSTASGSTLRSLESTGSVGSVLGAMNITTNLVVDGQTLATVVNNANNATASRTSSS